MSIGVLGPLTVDGAESGLGPRDRVVLAALTVARGQVLPAEQLADALWGDDPPASWSKVIQGCVVRLRKVLGRQLIETSPQGYRLVVPADDVDALRFDRLIGRARELLTLGEPERAPYLIDQALGLWRDRPLTDVEGWDRALTEAGRLDEQRLDAEELRVEAALRTGRHQEVLAEARTLVEQAGRVGALPAGPAVPPDLYVPSVAPTELSACAQLFVQVSAVPLCHPADKSACTPRSAGHEPSDRGVRPPRTGATVA